MLVRRLTFTSSDESQVAPGAEFFFVLKDVNSASAISGNALTMSPFFGRSLADTAAWAGVPETSRTAVRPAAMDREVRRMDAPVVAVTMSPLSYPGATAANSLLVDLLVDLFVDQADAEVLRGVGAGEQQRRVARDLGVGVGLERLHPYAVARRSGPELTRLGAHDRVVGPVVEDQQQRAQLAGLVGDRVGEHVVRPGRLD